MENCRSCRYFYITWDPQYPNGCKAYRFKSKKLPMEEVLQTSGMLCQCYLSKADNVKIERLPVPKEK